MAGCVTGRVGCGDPRCGRLSVVSPTVAPMTTSIAVPPAAGPPAGLRTPVHAAGGEQVGARVVGDPQQPASEGEARPRRPLALSPSRASDFKTCPLLYRFRAVDRLPEPPSAPAARGTLVHGVLEQMFGRPAAERTADLTAAQIGPLWEQMSVDQPELQGLLPTEELAEWLKSAQDLVRTYFTLEDPSRFTPEACEFAVEIEVADARPGAPPAGPRAGPAWRGRRRGRPDRAAQRDLGVLRSRIYVGRRMIM